MNRPAAIFALHVIGPTALGAAIYILFRQDTLLAFRWIDCVGLGDAVRASRSAVAGVHPPNWVRFVLPDGLWCWSATAWFWIIWRRINLWTLLPVALAVGAEFGQLTPLVPGTFDPHDIIAYAAGAAIPLLLIRKAHSCTTETPSSA